MSFDVDLPAFRSFVVLAATKSYTVAARELAISPSGLTKRIRTLERQVGSPLVVRHHGGVEGLTAAGTTLMRGASRLLRAVEAIHTSLRGDRLRVAIQGFDRRIAARRQMRVAALALRALRPGTSIEVGTLGYAEPAEALRRRQADLAITGVPLPAADVMSLRLWPLERVGVVRSSHPLARRSEVDAEEFAAHPMAYAPDIMAGFMSIWALGDIRPLGAARLVEMAPRTRADTVAFLESTGAAMALHPEAVAALPATLRRLPLRGAPRTWYYATVPRSPRNDLPATFLRLLYPAPLAPDGVITRG